MPEKLVVEPDELRQIAKQHDLAAANLRKWGEIPRAWLAEFQDAYGSIADPMRGALKDYYDRRHDRAERLAVHHEQTRDQLLTAARELEEGDQASGHQVRQAGGNDHGAPPGGWRHGAPTDPVRPVHNGPDTPMANGTPPGQPPITAPDTLGMPDGTPRSDQAPLSPAASAPQSHDTLPTGVAAPIGTTPSVGVSYSDTPSSVGVSEYGADTPGVAAADSSSPVSTSSGSSLVGGISTPLATDTYSTVDAGPGAGAQIPAPLAPGPFAAAVHSPERRQALPSLVVGERAEDDLALARTLLASILAVVADSARGTEWAVAVARTPDGPIISLTSTEGRGWLPPGLFLPSEVSLPWRWDSILRPADREDFAALEGTTDPARMLAEFGSMVGRRKSVRISALVSSAAIPDVVRAAVGYDVAIEEWVSGAESAVDFAMPGVGLVDRLALAGSDELLRAAATVPEAEILAKCLELTRAADARVRGAVSGIDAETVARRARRQQILDALHAGQAVPASWWDQIRAADDMMAAALWSRRVDVSHIPVGGVRTDASAEAIRGMVFERRADELLMLLGAGEPGRQTLRDVLYAYGQITEHPLLPAAAATGTTGVATAVPDVRVARSVRSDPHAVSSVSVGSSRLGGTPLSIDELLNRPPVIEGASEQRKD
ncbi:type VII secretion target [Nocardia sp. NPDC049707]|uniref:type VII secretion target n=1 Tax=Nocardia sp. NPDC049707 TaxID=3154735 RepID=UPI00342CA7DB